MPPGDGGNSEAWEKMLRSPDPSSRVLWQSSSVLALQRERRVATLAAERARLKQREAIGRTATRWMPNREPATMLHEGSSGGRS